VIYTDPLALTTGCAEGQEKSVPVDAAIVADQFRVPLGLYDSTWPFSSFTMTLLLPSSSTPLLGSPPGTVTLKTGLGWVAGPVADNRPVLA
jgi:hypothetical protein